MRNDRERIQDILDAISHIEKHAIKGRKTFDRDELVQIWMIYHLEIVGEAVRSISEGFKKANPQIPWKLIAGMRNILVHEYFAIDRDEVWATIEKDIPVLKQQLLEIFENKG